MAKSVYIAGVGLTKVDLTGRVFGSIFDLFAEAYRGALEDSPVRSFGAVQIGIMDSEEFENRANIAAKVADRLGLTGVPAIRSETASSTGAAAFHEAYYKIASGQCESVLVLAGERMKTVTTQAATNIMSKTVDPVERRFGFTMPGLIALVTQAWLRERGIKGKDVGNVLARLMQRAHALGAENPLAAFFGRREPLSAYFDESQNSPVATPLMRKDCSPICDGAAALILTSKPQAIRVAGIGSATETSSILDRKVLSHLDATRQAAKIAYWRAGIADPRRIDALVVEVHDAFNSLLPIGLVDLLLVDEDEAIGADIAALSEMTANLTDHTLYELGEVLDRLAVNISAYDVGTASDLLNISANITAFEELVQREVGDINTTLEDLEKLENIMADVDALDQSLTNAQGDIKADVQDTKDDQASRNSTNMMLIIVVMVLLFLVLYMVFRTQQMVKEVNAPKAEPEEPDDIVDIEMTELMLEDGHG